MNLSVKNLDIFVKKFHNIRVNLFVWRRYMKEEYTNQHRRWYDKDPVLSQAVETLEKSDDETQIRIALNLIKIIIEHNIEDERFEAVEDIINAVGSGLDDNRKGRWYDIDSTLRTAMNMLQNCPAATQHIIAREMAKMVVDSIKKEEDVDDGTNN